MGIRRLCFYELSAQVEAWLLWALRGEAGEPVKASPTLRPQGLLSKRRLREVLSAAQETDPKGFVWREPEGHLLQLGEALIAFYSANEAANVRGRRRIGCWR